MIVMYMISYDCIIGIAVHKLSKYRNYQYSCCIILQQAQCTQDRQLIYAELAPSVLNPISQPNSVDNTNTL